MKIAIGSDHRGLTVKQRVVPLLQHMGHEVTDVGPANPGSVDYPDFAFEVGKAIGDGRADRGILICGTGIGMCIAANKVHGVRAAPGQSDDEVRFTREHNDANVLTLGAKYMDEDRAMQLIEIFLNTEFAGGRHARRVAKIAQLEQPQ